MFDAVPSMGVKKVGPGITVLAPALSLILCVILRKVLPLSGPESPHVLSSLWGTTRNQQCCRAGALETNNGLSAHSGFAVCLSDDTHLKFCPTQVLLEYLHLFC